MSGETILKCRWSRSIRRSGSSVRNRILIAPSCSLLHSPVTLRHESAFDAEIKEWLAFAEEKLKEVTQLARLAEGGGDAIVAYRNRVALHSRRASERIHRSEVKARSQAVKPEDSRRKARIAERRQQQRAALGLPLLPTTTIGSFPQTADIRATRARWKRGELADGRIREISPRENCRLHPLAGRSRVGRAGAWRIRTQRHGRIFWRATRWLCFHGKRMGSKLRHRAV